MKRKSILGCLLVVFGVLPGMYAVSYAQEPQQNSKALPEVKVGKDGGLIYTQDFFGNRVPDYSYCGYQLSEQAIPEMTVKVLVPCTEGDATSRIQEAIDKVSALSPDENGFRGCVLLEKGVYQVAGSLKIRTSGVVLRGSGSMEGGTEIIGAGQDRTTLIDICGKNDRAFGNSLPIKEYVPVGSMSIVVDGHSFMPADRICIKRFGSAEWIAKMDVSDFGGESSYIGWKPEEIDIYWERQIKEIKGDTLFLDAPLTCAADTGEGSVCTLTWPGRIACSGVENLRLTSVYDESNAKDENHRWMAIVIDNAENCWVRRVEFRHFAGSAVLITERGSRVTVEDCKSLSPVSEIGGQRRYAFYTLGGQCLFQRLYAENGMHDFAVGRCVPGPTVFVQCNAAWSNHFSGAVDSWATGILMDAVSIEGNAISLANRGQDGMGAGWTAANSMLWNCSASLLAVPNPPTAYNWAYGSWGVTVGDVKWRSSGSFVKPYSLFYAQLAERMGQKSPEESRLMPFDTQSASNPPVDKAQQFVAEARQPAMQLTDWIDTLILRHPLSLDFSGKELPGKISTKNVQKKTAIQSKTHLFKGVLVNEDAILTGSVQGIVWWNGTLKDRYLKTARPCITRYVPGRTGLGFTDDLHAMTDDMLNHHKLITEHHYGLWYDRRRDDHERIRRMDGYVWAPFYEQPFARSGEGRAWDGLSRYDLTKWNVWYWNRLKQYADLADEKKLLLFHENYFQHNILEAGAHWADFPWRSANNINETGFPEPVPYASDKRIYMSELFYDVENPVRRELHRQYIRKCLDNFADNGSVIQMISAEFTGPLHFVAFWLDVIAEWEAETGHDALVALSTTKDVQDAILADSLRSKTVDIIDIRYWKPTADGGFYAPPGGKHLAPRQFDRLRGGLSIPGDGRQKSLQERVYETVAAYRTAYPDKAVIYSAEGSNAWPAFMGGASLCNLPAGLPAQFLKDAACMENMPSEEGLWLRGLPGTGYIVYGEDFVQIDLRQDKKKYWAVWLNPRTGAVMGEPFRVNGKQIFKSSEKGLLWLYR